MRKSVFAVCFVIACSSTKSSTVTSASTVASAVASTSDHAEIGRPAPDFSLPDVDGKTVSLSELKGKVVVLEWFNPKCPFVKRNHELGPLKDMAARKQKDGGVWLSGNKATARTRRNSA